MQCRPELVSLAEPAVENVLIIIFLHDRLSISLYKYIYARRYLGTYIIELKSSELQV